MLNRRFLRIKVLQALYAFFQSDRTEITAGEKEMLKSINKIFDLYLYMLVLITDVSEHARRNIEQNKEKRLPTDEDLNPNTKFIDNRVIAQIENNFEFKKQIDARKISWQVEWDNVRKLWRRIREGEEYRAYMDSPTSSFEEDKNFVLTIFRNYIGVDDVMHAFLEDRSIYWADDLTLVALNIIKTIQNTKEDMPQHGRVLSPLFKDKEDDLMFVKELFRKTISFNDSYSELIAEKTRNWEVDRIALIDVILMKMALCEFEHFSSIPVKVSLNEYIELAKNYSTTKSKVFINGVLDKLVMDLKNNGRVVKRGRGLIE